jgi:hypothetical protein
MSISLVLKTVASVLSGTALRDTLIADATVIENEANRIAAKVDPALSADGLAITLGGVQRTEWPAAGGTASGLNDVIQNGATANLPAGATDFSIKTTDGLTILFNINKATGAITFNGAVSAASAAFTGPASAGPATLPGHVVILDQVGIQKVNDFRLTLTSGLPVTSADVTAAATIYCTPYKGNNISLYDGAAWHVRESAQMSLAIGTLASATIPQDIFCYDNAGVPTLEMLPWSTINARATALAYQNGILVKSGDATRRYLGSSCPTSTTTTEDSQSNRYLWNYYNRIPRLMLRHDTTSSWSYATLTWRQARADTNNKLNFFVGYVEDFVSAKLLVNSYCSAAGVHVQVALGLNSTTTPSGEYSNLFFAVGNAIIPLSATLNTHPILGLNYISWLEQSEATGTYYGWDGASQGSGLSGGVLA